MLNDFYPVREGAMDFATLAAGVLNCDHDVKSLLICEVETSPVARGRSRHTVIVSVEHDTG
jgi:hypothetical protein